MADILQELIKAGIASIIPVGYEGDDAKEREEAGE
jgi:hypothetical protein